MIRCITFDLDDTLWAVDPVITHANQTMFDWLEENAPLFTQYFKLSDLPQLRQQVLLQQPEIEYSVTLIRRAQLTTGLLAAGYSENETSLLMEKAFEVFIKARQQVIFFEHAREMLSELKQKGFLLGALSNGNADIKRVGLSDLISFQFKADEVGSMKPEPEMFHEMLHHTGLRPEQVIHVGDNPEHDIAGADAQGIWTIMVNLQNKRITHQATAEVDCLSKIPQVVAQIDQRARERVTL